MPRLANTPAPPAPEKDKSRIYKQRLKCGQHEQKDIDGVDRIYSPGEEVSSYENLAARWPERFEPPHASYFAGQEMSAEAGQATIPSLEQQAFDSVKTGTPPAPTSEDAARKVAIRAGYEKLNVNELRKLAAEEEIQVAGNASKADLITALVG